VMVRPLSTAPAITPYHCQAAARRLCASALAEADAGTSGTAAQRRRLVRERCTERIGELEGELAAADAREQELMSKVERLRRQIKKRCLKEFGLTPEAERRRADAAQRLAATEAVTTSKLPGVGRIKERAVRMAINQHWSAASEEARKEFQADHTREMEARRRKQREQKDYLDAQKMEREAARAEERQRNVDLARSAQRSTDEWRETECRVAASVRHRLVGAKEEMESLVASRNIAHREERLKSKALAQYSFAANQEAEREERERRKQRKQAAVEEYRAYLDQKRSEKRPANEPTSKSGVPDDGEILMQRKAKAAEILAAKQAPCLAMLADAAERRREVERKAREEEKAHEEWERQDDTRRKQAIINRNRAQREALDQQVSANKAEELRQQAAVGEEKGSLRRQWEVEREEDVAAARRRKEQKRRRAEALSTLAEVQERSACRGVAVKVI